MPTTIVLNGRPIALDIPPATPLLWAIREAAALAGTKFGCGIGQCGACTLHVDGKPTRSCITPLGTVRGKAITTIEGAASPIAQAVKAAWEKLDVAQCGYCQPGQIMSAIALLGQKQSPTDADIDGAMSGNLCRCATYVRIRAAIHEASRMLRRSEK